MRLNTDIERSGRLLALVLWLVPVPSFVPSPATASRAIGIRTPHILVQEYWEYGEPRYVVVNMRAEETVVDLYPEGAELDEKSLITSWVLPPHAIVVEEPIAAMRSQYIQVRIEEQFEGVMRPMDSAPTDADAIAVLTNSSINSGGWGGERNLWLQAPTYTLGSGETIQVELHARAPVRRITFGDKVSLMRQFRPQLDDDDLEGYRSELDVLLLQVVDAGLAHVAASENVIAISLPDGLDHESEVVVTLSITAPEVETRTLARLHAHREEEFRRGSLTRLFIVEP